VPKITNKFENILNKYRTKNLTKAVDFLSRIKIGSQRTALVYSHALELFNSFIEQNYKDKKNNNKYNIQTILEPLKKNKIIDRYELLNDFIKYLQNDTVNGHDLSAKSVRLYVGGVRSYLTMFDVETTSHTFKHKVRSPPVYHEYQEPVSANQIRDILSHCNNRRLKAYLLVLASSGMRAVEALALRECDINEGKEIDPSTISPTMVKVREKYAKTHRARITFISDEAARHLKAWIDWKYRDRHAQNKRVNNRVRNKDDLIFSNISAKDPFALYFKMLVEFQKVLESAGFTQRKEDGVQKRHKITFHSFRRFVKTQISNSGYRDFSEKILGHFNTYYNPVTREDQDNYKGLMPKLTFLEYETIEAKGKDYEAKLKEKEQEIIQLRSKIENSTEQLRERDRTNAETIAKIQEQITQLQDSKSHSKELAGDALQRTMKKIQERDNIIVQLSNVIFKGEGKTKRTDELLRNLRNENIISEEQYSESQNKSTERKRKLIKNRN
jgi:integrase